MRTAIIDFQYKTKEYFTQEMAGSYGIKTSTGNSFLAKLIMKNKKRIKFPVIMLAYLAAIFENNGHEVVVIDDEDGIMDADLYILHSSIVNFRKEIQLCREIKARTNAKIGIIGPFCSVKPEIFIDHVDFIINGEPENIVKTIKDKSSIPEGVVVSAPVSNLDELPFPAWKYFNIDKYTHGVGFKKPFLELSGSRGCSASCNYCSYRAYYGNHRGRTVESVIREISYLKDNFNIKSLCFRDSNFTYRKEWAVQLANEMIKHKFDIEWSCEARLDLLDKELVNLLKEAGLRHLGIGIESFNEKLLKQYTRLPIKKKHQEDIIKHFKNIGLSFVANYIFGFPSDTKKNILETIRYAKKLNTPLAAFALMTPYPGSVFYEKIKDKIYEEDFEKFTSTNPVFEVEGITKKELLELIEKAYVSYYFRPAWILRHGWRYIL